MSQTKIQPFQAPTPETEGYDPNRLHLCVGFYNNGDFKCNTVKEENLKSNIEYNDAWRPGRFYFVDGQYACGGVLKEPYQTEYIEECIQRIKDLGLRPKPYDTAPYE